MKLNVMNNSFNDEVNKSLKIIVDSVRCIICDKAEGDRGRYPCGHTVCNECLTACDGCMLCLTPPSSSVTAITDEPFTARAKNACSLLNIYQETFNLDVYRTIRKSEQLKTEKELFPDCIQAPAKYSNKRKSLASSNKKNVGEAFYPGENIPWSHSFKMNNSNNYVQQWLNKNKKPPRKVLGDLSVNCKSNENILFTSDTVKTIKSTKNKDQCVNITDNKKRTRLYSTTSDPILNTDIYADLYLNTNKLVKKGMDKNKWNKNDNDESGIVIDDEPILIEDSQSPVLDKDELALLAVNEADNKEADVMSLDNIICDLLPHERNLLNADVENHKRSNQKVIFFKKSALSDNCLDCKEKIEIKDTPRNVSITIENDSFVAEINISNLLETAPTKNSVYVQTELSDIPLGNTTDTIKGNEIKINGEHSHILPKIKSNFHHNEIKQSNVSSKRVLESLNMFESHESPSNKKRCIVIDESDSDEGNFEDNTFHVTAEVHRSCDPLDYGVLGEISSNLTIRPRVKARGATPDSNNSSDKENCDPNKRKKLKSNKKKFNK